MMLRGALSFSSIVVRLRFFDFQAWYTFKRRWNSCRQASNNSISQLVLIASRSSEYFHFDKSYFCLPISCCWARIASDLQKQSKSIRNFVLKALKAKQKFLLNYFLKLVASWKLFLLAVSGSGKFCGQISCELRSKACEKCYITL